MPVYTICPTCSAGYNLNDVLRGKKVLCKSCNAAFVVAEALRVPALVAAPAAQVAAPAPPADRPMADDLGLAFVNLELTDPPPAPRPAARAVPQLAEPLLMAQPYQAEVEPEPIPVAQYADPHEAEWSDSPRPRPRRRRQEREGRGLSGGALAALIATPILLLLAIGLVIWWVNRPLPPLDDPLLPPDAFENRRPGFLNPQPAVMQPGFRPGVPIIIPPPRFNQPQINPPRFNPPPFQPPVFQPPRFQPPRFNPPVIRPPVRIR